MRPPLNSTPTPEIVIVPATAERWDDLQRLLDGGSEKGCWCQPWRGLETQPMYRGLSRPEILLAEMANDVAPPPGFLAYVDGVAVGWCGVADRTRAPRLANSRTIPTIDDRPVWAIGCFRIRVGHRRRGVARALLAGVVEAARAAGAPGVEAYPVDPEGARIDVGFGFVGFASMFDAAGFRRVQLTDAHSAGLTRWLVRLDF